MRFVRALRLASPIAGVTLLIGVAAAAWTGCGPTSSQLPTGTWSGAEVDASTSGASGDDPDGSAAVATPSAVADGGKDTGAAGDASAAGDGAGGDADDDAASEDAASDLDTGSALTTFTLLDTTVTNVVMGQPVTGWNPIPEGSTINLGKVGTALSIRANTTPATVGSVGFLLDGTTAHTENAVPYTECSDNGAGVVTACTYSLGAHVLVVTPYSAADLGGTAMASTTLYFTIVDKGGDGGADAQ
jgi:hypothetical protein